MRHKLNRIQIGYMNYHNLIKIKILERLFCIFPLIFINAVKYVVGAVVQLKILHLEFDY